MKIVISTKNISLDDALRTFVEEKIGGLGKFLKDPTETRLPRPGSARVPLGERTGPSPRNNLIEVRVEIGKPSKHHRSGRVYYAEINLKVGGELLRATCQHEDLRNAIVDVKDELQEQIRKFKEKRMDLSRQAKE